MAKLNAEEFNKKYSEKIVDNDDLLIELLEDATDSITNDESEELESLRKELSDAKMMYEESEHKYIELVGRYKERFLTSVEDAPIEETIVEEPKEEEIIDVKEI